MTKEIQRTHYVALLIFAVGFVAKEDKNEHYSFQPQNRRLKRSQQNIQQNHFSTEHAQIANPP